MKSSDISNTSKRIMLTIMVLTKFTFTVELLMVNQPNMCCAVIL